MAVDESGNILAAGSVRENGSTKFALANIFSTASEQVVTVSDVAPTINIAGDTSFDEGVFYSVTFTATDPADTIAEWTIDWGDGEFSNWTAAEPGTDITQGVNATTWEASHTYTEYATRHIVPIATDDDGKVFNELHIGDANADGVINTADLAAVVGHMNQTGTIWPEGNFNGDNITNTSDLAAVSGNWQLSYDIVSHSVTVNVIPLFSSMVVEDGTLAFSPNDFCRWYSETGEPLLEKVKVVDLPLHGSLDLFGVPVKANDEIDYDCLRYLSYVPESGFTGTDYFFCKGHDGVQYETDDSSMVINVGGVNDAPILDELASPTLTSINEDCYYPTGNMGDTVAEIIVDSSITESGSQTPVEAIAITWVDNAYGVWQYQLAEDSGWADIIVSEGSSLLLGSADLIRFCPDPNFYGDVTFSFRAWDKSNGLLPGDYANTRINGDSSPFSAISDRVKISVDPVNDAPQLDDTPMPTLTTIYEDDFTSTGNAVAEIVVDDSIKEVSATDVEGIDGVEAIAITFVYNSNGDWQYQLTNQESWNSIVASDEASLLLGPTDKIRFVPDQDFYGSAIFSYRAWDQSAGESGTTADTTYNGGTFPFSENFETATITVAEMRDAPLLDSEAMPQFSSICEDSLFSTGDTVAEFVIDGSITDISGQPLVESIAITGVDNTNGTWQYHLEGESNWLDIKTEQDAQVSDNAALLLGPNDHVRFVPVYSDDYYGTATLSFRAWDQSAGINGDFVDTTANGKATPFSTAYNTATISIEAVNDAPVLDNTETFVLTAIEEDSYDPVGNIVADFIVDGSITESFGEEVIESIAIVSVDNLNGIWQYKLQESYEWTDLLNVSEQNSLLLDSNDSIRFVPNANFAGISTFDFRAWDQSHESSQQVNFVDVTFYGYGGTTPFSSNIAIASIAVTGFNDAPILDDAANPGLYPIDEDNQNSQGNTVAEIIVDSSISETQGETAVEAIAITSVDSTNGTWQYQLEEIAEIIDDDDDYFNGGDGWMDIVIAQEGKVLVDFDSGSDRGLDSAILPNGHIVSCGYTVNDNGQYDFAIICQDSENGSLVTNFGTGGKVALDFAGGFDVIYGIAIDQDGNILAAGTIADANGVQQLGIAKIFSTASKQTVSVEDVTPSVSATGDYCVTISPMDLDADKIDQWVIDLGDGTTATTATATRPSGSTGSYPENWDVDNSKVVVTQVENGTWSVSYDDWVDDSCIVSAWAYEEDVENSGAYIEHKNDVPSYLYGELDPSFGNSGYVTESFCSSGFSHASEIFVQDDGKILVAGCCTDGILLARFNPDGTLDTSYGDIVNSPGKEVFDIYTGQYNNSIVKIRPDGTIVAVGYENSSGNLFIANFTDNGQIDTTFGDTELGYTFDTIPGITEVSDICILPSGDIIIAGSLYLSGITTSYDAFFAKYSSDGVRDQNFNNGNGYLSFDGGDIYGDHAYSVEVLSQGDGSSEDLLVATGSSGIYQAIFYFDSSGDKYDNTASGGSISNGIVEIPHTADYLGGGRSLVIDRGSLEDDSDDSVFITGFDHGKYSQKSDFLISKLTIDGALDSNFTQNDSLLLGPNDRIRFVPNADFYGSATFTFRAWDQSEGHAGGFLGTSFNGYSTPFSVDTDTASVMVNGINDAPAIQASTILDLPNIKEDPVYAVGNTVAKITDSESITDSWGEGPVDSVAITSVDNNNGTWKYRCESDAAWTPIGAVSETSALLLGPSDQIYFAPNADFSGSSSFTFRAWDQSDGRISGQLADTTTNGGQTSFSTGTATVGIEVISKNDAPVLEDTESFTLLPIVEDSVSSAGTSVATIVQSSTIQNPITDVDVATPVKAIAIVSADNSHGSWQYKLSGSSEWIDLDPWELESLLLDENDLVRFVPNPDFNGVATFEFRAWDKSDNRSSGESVDTTSIGGSTAFSEVTATASITVNAVGDSPVLDLGFSNTEWFSLESYTIAGFLSDGSIPNFVDGDEVQAIAITVASDTNGIWQFCLEGTNIWSNIEVEQGVPVSESTALLLGPTDKIRFIPSGDTVVTSAAFTFRSWDYNETDAGTPGTFVPSTGDNFSSSTATATLSIPCLSQPTVTPTYEDNDFPGYRVDSLPEPVPGEDGNTWTSESEVTSITITSSCNDHGIWQFKKEGEYTWSDITAYLILAKSPLSPSDCIRFVPAENHYPDSSDKITYTASDGETGSGEATFEAVPQGSSVSQIVTDNSIRSEDGVDLDEAIAITGVDNTNGIWQYHLEGESNWLDIKTEQDAQVSDNAALLLGAGDHVRFVPNLNYNGSSTFNFRVWDNTDISLSHGNTANTDSILFSNETGTAKVEVFPVNDAPELDSSQSNKYWCDYSNNKVSRVMTVAEILNDSSITDIDGAAVKGIAISEVWDGTDHNFHWYYSLPNSSTWTLLSNKLIDQINSLYDPHYLLLGPDCKIKLEIPDNGNINQAKLDFLAWDMNGDYESEGLLIPDTPENGGVSPFSTDESVITVSYGWTSSPKPDESVTDLPLTQCSSETVTSLGLSNVTYTGDMIYVITELPPSDAGTVQLSDGTAVVLGQEYTLTQIQGMDFNQELNVTERGGVFSFTVTDTNTNESIKEEMFIYISDSTDTTTPVGNETYADLYENCVAGQHVLYLTNNDPRALLWEISGDPEGIFYVDIATHELKVKKPELINYEANDYYGLTVVLRTPGSSASAEIDIDIYIENVTDSTDFVKLASSDGIINFSIADFDLSNNPDQIKITQIPSHGQLTKGANPVSIDEIINKTDLINLHYSFDTGYTYDSFQFIVGDNSSSGATKWSDEVRTVTLDHGILLGDLDVSLEEDDSYVFTMENFQENFLPYDFSVNAVPNSKRSSDGLGINSENYKVLIETFSYITIKSLPDYGSLNLDINGNSIAVTIGMTISKADLAAGNLCYVPNGDFQGTDSFTWNTPSAALYDSSRESNTAEFESPIDAQVLIKVASLNDAPVAIGGEVIVQGGAIMIDLGHDGDEGGVGYEGVEQELSLNVIKEPEHGQLSGFDPITGEVVYTPNEGYVGPDSFYFTLTDDNSAGEIGCLVSEGDSDIVIDGKTISCTQVLLSITPLAPPSFNIDEDVSLTDQSIGVSIDGHTIAGYEITEEPIHGTISDFVSETGTFTYTPDLNYNGDDSFSFTASYYVNGSDGPVVTSMPIIAEITVNPVNDATVLGDQELAMEIGSLLQVLLGNDGDPEVTQELSYYVTTAPTNGTLSDFNPSTGEIIYTPYEDVHGTDSFSYKITDDLTAGGTVTTTSDIATVTIHVEAMPVAIVPSQQSLTTNEDTAITVSGLTADDNDSEVERTLSGFAIFEEPTHGTISDFMPGTGAFTYTPDPNYNGTDSFSFTASYYVSGSDGPVVTSMPTTVDITVTSDNDKPVANSNTLVFGQNDSIVFVLTGDDGDSEVEQSLTYAMVTDPKALYGNVELDTATGEVTYTPDTNFPGYDSFTFTLTDDDTAGGVAITSEAATVDILVLSSLPTATPQLVSTDEDTPLSLILAGDDGDPDSNPNTNETLTFAITSDPSFGSVIDFDSSTGELTYLPNEDFNGDDSFSFTVSYVDGQGNAIQSQPGIIAISVSAVNDVPLANTLATTVPLSPTVISLGNDGDWEVDQSLLLEILVAPEHGTLSDFDPITGNITYTPNNLVGDEKTAEDTFSFNLTDDTTAGSPGALTSDTGNIEIKIKTPPQATNYTGDDTVLVAEDQTANITLAGQTAEPSGSTLTFVIVSDPKNGIISDFDEVTGKVSYTPDSDYNGPDSFSFVVYEQGEEEGDLPVKSEIATVDISVNAVNDVPVIYSDSFVTRQDGSIVFVLTGDDGDPEVEQSLTYAIVSDPEDLNHGSAVLDPATGEVTYTPYTTLDPSTDFTDSITFNVTDDNTAGGDPITSSETATITINIGFSPVANGDDVTTTEDTPYTLTTLTGAGSDPSRTAILSYVVVVPPDHGTLGEMDPETGDVTYTPDPDYNGSDSFSFVVLDDNAAPGLQMASEPATVNITVNAVNDAPVANSLDLTLDENGSVSFVPGDDGDWDVEQTIFWYSDSSCTSPFHGTLTGYDSITGEISITEGITYTPTLDYVGTDDFYFKLKEEDGEISDLGHITITVNPVNHEPVAISQSDTTSEDNSIQIELAGNNGDLGSLDFAHSIIYTLVSQPSHGTLTNFDPVNGTVTYTPDDNYNNSPLDLDSFLFTVSEVTEAGDTSGLSSSAAAVTIEVTPVNDAPIAENQSVNALEDRQIFISLYGDDGDSEVDQSLTFELVQPLPEQMTEVNFDESTGQLSFMPASNFSGNFTFQYRVDDDPSDDPIEPATVTVNVEEVTDIIVAQPESFTTTKNDAITINLPTVGNAGEAQDFVFSIISQPVNGTLSNLNTSTGSVDYTPSSGYSGEDSFTFQVSDQDGNQSSADYRDLH